MAKKTPIEEPKPARASGAWPVSLSAMAAVGREDGGVGMKHLLAEAGFAEKPAMTIIVKRPRKTLDPYVDDVLDALRALCA